MPATVPLRDLATFNPAPPSLNAGEEVALVPMASVSEMGVVQVSEHVPVSDLKAGYSYMRTGDVLVAKITPCFENNKIALAKLDRLHGFGSTEFHVIRADPSALDNRYLVHFLRRDETRRAGEQRMTGSAGQRRVPRQFLEDLTIPLPPLDEQRRIAAILDQADDLRRKRREALERLEKLAGAIFLQMFGDPRRNNLRLEAKPLGSLVENQDSIRVPVKASDRAETPGKFPYYGASGIIDYVDDYLFDGERLLVGEDGANLLARSSPIAFRANGKFWVNNHAHVLADSGIANLIYLEYHFERIDLTAYVSGTAQPKLTRASLDRIPFLYPDRKSQDAFAARVSEIDALKVQHRDHLAKLDALFASLQHRAFRGEL
jgi:type I restriction enzyme S subunit